MNLCRLCGEEKSPLDFSIELNDITSANWSYRDLIELHTRVSLKANKLLPQSICEDCRALIDRFVEFSRQVEKVQEGFDEEQLDPISEVKECFVQIEPLEIFGKVKRKFQRSNSFFSSDSDSDHDFRDYESDSEKDEKPIKRRKTLSKDTKTFKDLFHNELDTSYKPKIHLDTARMNKKGEVTEVKSTLRWSDIIKDCSLCNESIENLIELKNHHQSAHNSQDTNMMCPFCTNSFKKSQSLLNHLLKKHPKSEHLKFW